MAQAATPATDDNVEILVHVAAPAMSKDDATYRALANAYLAFHAASRTSLPACTSQHAPQGPTTPEPPPSKTHEPFATEPALPIVTPNKRPSHRSPPGNDAEMTDAEDSWIAPPSTVPDSMPWNDLRLPELSSPSRTMEHFLGLLEDCSALDDSSLDDSVMRTSPIQRRGGIAPQINNESKSVGAAVPPVVRHDLTGPVSWAEENGGDDSIIEETILEDTTVEDTTVEDTSLSPLKRKRPHHSRAGSDPLPSKHARLPSPDHLARSSSDTGLASPSPQTPAYPLTLRNPSDSTFISLLEIEAPAPKTSAASLSPDDLITPNMHLLMRSFGLPRRLDSVTRHRALKPFERGYWLLDCAGWEPGLAHRAWGFLYNYITDGFAGWGSRCVREAGWQWIRFWSFGHVANHVYLLLHVATERAIKSEEIAWVDGAGDVVLVTKGHA
ncbi:conserved hypothetical protein [Verticillium alfalfae VaMs.102]|uniref:Uncharacterized protein n=1 Tax=Verticillium alfalfae (strain VaMs.102 / ATCC MYA-4576 / FGSC 10136) TaxID=526221 RepID=C9SI52_VERA1|nr:conserved hypothetical protein [Verticillium alfalfae VaMs.102]EEY18625.1 conserved hypothetical protein [Verticillium alfalfae VaMs.102]